MRVFRSRARNVHDPLTTVATNGTRIITADNGHGHGHRGDATVVTVAPSRVSSRHGHHSQHGREHDPRIFTVRPTSSRVSSFRGHRSHHGHGNNNVITVPASRVSSRHGHGHGHGEPTVVTVPATHGSSHHHGHGGPTVVAANVSSSHGHRTHGTSSHRRYYNDEPSTMHGLWNKFIGTITGNRRRWRHGDREMRKARDKREALRVARRVQRVRDGGHLSKLQKFRERRSRRRHNRDDPIVISQDTGTSRRRTPWMHHKHRTLPPYHGMHHSIMGFFTGRKDRRAMGQAMAAAAEEERRRERRRRNEELRDMGRRYRERRRY